MPETSLIDMTPRVSEFGCLGGSRNRRLVAGSMVPAAVALALVLRPLETDDDPKQRATQLARKRPTAGYFRAAWAPSLSAWMVGEANARSW
jgi:hypothetical protein